jgi:hypothetical protein
VLERGLRTSRLVAQEKRVRIPGAGFAVDGSHGGRLRRKKVAMVEVPQVRSRRAGGPGRALWHALGPKREAAFEGLAVVCRVALVELN